jgi:hypothetical protein
MCVKIQRQLKSKIFQNPPVAKLRRAGIIAGYKKLFLGKSGRRLDAGRISSER